MSEQEVINTYIKNFTRVCPAILVRKLKITHSRAEYLCLRIWHGQWKEARRLRENDGCVIGVSKPKELQDEKLGSYWCHLMVGSEDEKR
jgi:hypothetical protein